MSNKDLKLALELAAKATGREEIAELNKEVGNLGPISNEVEKETKELAQRMQQLGQQRDQIDAFNKSKDALTQLELATVLSRDKLESLRKVQATGAGDAEQLAKQEKLLASEVKQLESQLVRQAATHTKLGAGLKQSGIDTRNLGTEQNRLQREITETASRTEKLARELTGSKAAAASFAGSVGGVTTRLLAMGAAYLGIDRVWESLKAMFASGDQAERLSVQLKAVMGSIQGGAEATAWINKFATETPLQLDEVTQLFVRLKAFGLDPMDGSLQAIVDQTYKLGGSFEEAQGISLALGQAWAKQKLQGEEILQMIERGVPVWSLLEQVTGKNTAELQKLSEAGKLGRDTIKALMEEIGKQSAGAAADNMSLLSGLISNAKDNLEKFYRMVAENGALDWLKQQLATLNAEFAKMAADGSLQQWAKKISDAVVSTGEFIKSFIQTCYEWSGALKTVALAFAAFKFTQFIGGVQSAAKALVVELIPALLRTGQVASGAASAGASKLASSFGLLIARANAYAIAIGAVVAAGYGIGEIAKGIFDLTEGLEIKNRIAEQERQLNDQLLRQGAELIAQNAQYNDLQILTATQIKYLSTTEQAAYEQRLNGLKNYLAGQLQQNAALERAGQLTEEQKNKTLAAVAAMREGFAALEAGQQAALSQASKSLADYTADVTAAAEATKRLADAGLDDVFSKAKLDLAQISGQVGKVVTEYVSGLDTMTKASSVNALAIQSYLEKAFDSTKNQSELQAVIDKMALLHDQGKLVGVPYVESMAQASEAAKKLSKDSVEGAVIFIDLLKQQKAAAQEAYKSGLISADEYKQTVGKLNQELTKTSKQQKANADAADKTADAYQQLGVKSTEALVELAAKNKAAYNSIKLNNEGLAVQRQAFLVYAQSELEAAAATGRYADASLYAQAASLGLSDQLVTLIQTVDATGASADQTSEQLRELLKLQNQVNGTGEKPQKTTAEQNAENIQKAMEATAAGAQSAAEHINGYSSALQQMAKDMSAQTEAMMSNIMGWTRGSAEASSAVSTLNQKLADNAAQWRDIRSAVTLDDIQGHIKDLGLAYLASERAYLKQALAAEKMTAQLTDVDSVTARTLKRAEGLYKNLDMLDEQDLSGLKSAIDAARSKMEALEDSAKSTLNSLLDELDQYNGALDAVEKRDYETKMASLKEQLEIAKAAQDSQAIADLKKSMAILEELHKKKMQDIADEAAAKKKAAAEEAAEAAESKKSVTSTASQSASSASSTTTASAASNSDERTIHINLGGKTATVKATSANATTLIDLLTELEKAGAITI